ncbi:MAG: T9SS type A sorting domain-containing protein [Bacteroidales bacterium]|nr:T9SS type A sorting domain-containing protein [Bacteroidales bacterium]MCF8457371.1 T9SS type A sorting domain-containing protein [Bacteroidales bacterium]
MRNFAKIKKVLIIAVSLLVCNLCLISQASSQNVLMPIPSGHVMDFTGCGTGGNASLPIGFDPTPCNPKDESSLSSYYWGSNYYELPFLDGFYIGQYPKFCQQVVHDDRGNILFFIVDNNIYNRNGVGFENPDPIYDFWFLHPSINSYQSNDIHRFQLDFILRPELSIVPVPQSDPNDCDLKFYIFYAISEYTGTKDAPYITTHFVRMLTYTDENTIDLTTPQIILDEAGLGSLASTVGPGTISCGITEYNETYHEYMYFIQGGGYFFIYQVTNIMGNIVLANAKVYYDNTCFNGPYDNLQTELEICKPPNQNYYLIAYPLYSKHFATLKVVDNFSSITEASFGPFYTANIHSFAASNLTGIIDYNLVVEGINDVPGGEWDHTFVGMEFTSNGDFLYMTQDGFTGFKCYDLTNDISYRYSTASYDFSHSHIELGKDNTMYFANTTYIPPVGNYTNIVGNLVTLSNPETPGIVQGNPVLSNNNLASTSIPLSGSILDFAGSIFYPHFDFSDQVDGFEFSEYYTSINKVFMLDAFPLTLSANEVWSPGCTNNPFQSIDGNVYLIDDVTIPKGKNIEIQNMTFHFPEGTHMYLEAGNSSNFGAFLKLNNTTFTSLHSCSEVEDFWGGLVLYGDISQPQGSYNSSKQPVVYMINNSKIENAKTGIYSKNGGIVVANTCSFENNKRAVKFYDFQNKTSNGLHDMINMSSFSKCDFTVDDNFLGIALNPQVYFQEHVNLEKVDGIKFIACDFDNQQTSVNYDVATNYGIHSSEAGFYVDCFCDMSPLQNGQECPDQYKTSSVFTNLNVAINIEDGTKAVKISDCEFEDNITGIGVTGLDYPVITRNDFTIGETGILNVQNPKHIAAIKTIGSTGFQIEENKVFLSTNPNSSFYTFGIITQNSGYDNNEVYLNDFHNIEICLNPLDINRHPNLEASGLQLLCNHFNATTEKDIAVDFTTMQINSGRGIRSFQGNGYNNTGISAGNEFTMNIGTQYGNLYNNTERVINYFCPCIQNCSDVYFPYEATPYYVNPIQSTSTNTCPSHLSQGYVTDIDPTLEAATESNYYASKMAYYNLLYSFYQQLDGGNTPAILLEIQNTWPQEAWDLRNDLMAMAPFVSTQALEEAAQACVLPDAMLLEICLANPDATRSQEFLDFLSEGIPCPLPQYMVDMIQDNWDAETSRTLLENGLAKYGAERDFYANVLIRAALFKDEYELSDLTEWHEERANLSDYYANADLYIDNNDFGSAETVLDDVLTDFDLDDQQLVGHENYVDYFDFMLSLFNNNKTIHDLNSTELSNLQAIADEPLGFAKAKAKSILCFAYNICEPYYGYVSDAQPKSVRSNSQDPYKIINESYNKLIVSPNPASNFTSISWEAPLLEDGAIIKITDITGKVIVTIPVNKKMDTHVWETNDIEEGVYLIELCQNSNQLAHSKLVITK